MISSALLLVAAVQTTGQPSRVTVDPTTASVAAGSSTQLSVTAFDSAGNRLPVDSVFWISSDDAIATVTATGLVMGVTPGDVQITALVSGRPGFATVIVPTLPAAEIELSLPVTTLPAGTSVPIEVVARSRVGTAIGDPQIEFESLDPSVAHVDELGRVYATSEGTARIRARSSEAFQEITLRVVEAMPATYTIEPEMAAYRTGDVVRFRVNATGQDGRERTVFPAWSIDRPGAHIETDRAEGIFVAEQPGRYRVTAMIGESLARTTVVSVTQRHVAARLTMVGRGPAADHHSGDTWVFEGVDGRDYAYIGTFFYDWMKVWDVTNPADPVLTDSIQLDARRINDVKIHPNNRVGIVTREGASDRRNGIVLLDLTTPAHPTILSEYTATVTGGVHNVWIHGPGDVVYAAHNGTSDIHIIDISDPRSPLEVGRWGLDKQDKGLHDVIVQDGYAYLSYWDDGVVMLDIGAGSHGGSPTQPAFVSQFKYPIGNTHVAWRAGQYLFIGDELFPPGWNADFPIEARGYIHVVDYSDPERPVEVARYEVPEAGAHNVWVEGNRLFVGYYQGGLRVLDISGELRGDLYRQGREIAVLKTSDAQTTTPNWPMTWGAQVFKGHIYTSDLNSGLWIARLDEEVIIP
jgi:hypothetical protein